MRYLLIFTLLLLTGCGFHLRGSVELPPELSEISVKGRTTDIAPELSSGLKNAGVQVSDSAPMVLQLKAEKYGKRVLSVDSTGRAQEYGLSYTVRFSLKDEGKGGAVWISETSITQTRDLRFDATAVLGTANEETLLKTEMRRDAVSQILRQLQYAKAPAVKSTGLPEQPPLDSGSELRSTSSIPGVVSEGEGANKPESE
jgi:LPS-assembly lipoprotein